MVKRTLRATLGLGVGVALAIALPDYLGLALAFVSYWRSGVFTPHEANVFLSLGAFCALTSLLITLVASLLFMEFLRSRSRLRLAVTIACLAALSGMAIAHLLAIRMEWVGSEMNPLPVLIDSLAPSAWLILGAVACFALLVRASDVTPNSPR